MGEVDSFGRDHFDREMSFFDLMRNSAIHVIADPMVQPRWQIDQRQDDAAQDLQPNLT